jgi:hypothetical protein
VCRQEVDMPKQYAPEFRRKVVERLLNGETVKSLVAKLHVSNSGPMARRGVRRLCVLGLRRQDRDQGIPRIFAPVSTRSTPGVSRRASTRDDVDALIAARRRIRELEDELKMTRAASELFAEGQANPKSDTRW